MESIDVCGMKQRKRMKRPRIGGGLKFWVLFLLTVTVALVDKFDFDSGSKVDLDKNKWLFF
mgnify:CR=1 FL=1